MVKAKNNDNPEKEVVVVDDNGMDKQKEKSRCWTYDTTKQIDGGWAWMVFVSNAVNYFMLVPMLQNFALIYRDRFRELRLPSTNVTTIISTNSAFGMILGILNAPLLKIYGFRKMAFVAITLYTIGYWTTSFAETTLQFLITYGMITSVGSAFDMAAYNLAFNSYFRKRRSRVTGHLMGVTGIGPIVMPLFISFLLERLGMVWTVRILVVMCAALLFPSACLLKPITEEVKDEKSTSDEKSESSDKKQKRETTPKQTTVKIETKEAMQNGQTLPDQPVNGTLSKLSYANLGEISSSTTTLGILEEVLIAGFTGKTIDITRASVETLDGYDLEYGREEISRSRQQINKTRSRTPRKRSLSTSSVKTVVLPGEEAVHPNPDIAQSDSEEEITRSRKSSKTSPTGVQEPLLQHPYENVTTDGKAPNLGSAKSVKKESGNKSLKRRWQKVLTWLKVTYDLDLLTDPSYIILVVGMSIAVVAEITFSVMTPFILQDCNLDTQQIAVFYSILSTGDIALRFIAPYIGEYFKLSTKAAYLFALVALAVGRAGLYLMNSYQQFLIMAALLGTAKGFRTVYWILVIPNSVPLEKLASASAMQNVINGVLMLISGPIIGALIEFYQDYRTLIWIADVLTLTTVVLWSCEYCYKANKARRNRKWSGVQAQTKKQDDLK